MIVLYLYLFKVGNSIDTVYSRDSTKKKKKKEKIKKREKKKKRKKEKETI